MLECPESKTSLEPFRQVIQDLRNVHALDCIWNVNSKDTLYKNSDCLSCGEFTACLTKRGPCALIITTTPQGHIFKAVGN